MQATFRRNRELSLLILALIVGTGAMALVAVARNLDRLELAIPFIVTIAVGYIAAHIILRRLAQQADSLILPLAATINTLGLAAVYRLAPPS